MDLASPFFGREVLQKYVIVMENGERRTGKLGGKESLCVKEVLVRPARLIAADGVLVSSLPTDRDAPVLASKDKR